MKNKHRMTKDRAEELIEEVIRRLGREDGKNHDLANRDYAIALRFAQNAIEARYPSGNGKNWPRNLLLELGFLVLDGDIDEIEANLQYAITF